MTKQQFRRPGDPVLYDGYVLLGGHSAAVKPRKTDTRELNISRLTKFPVTWIRDEVAAGRMFVVKIGGTVVLLVNMQAVVTHANSSLQAVIKTIAKRYHAHTIPKMLHAAIVATSGFVAVKKHNADRTDLPPVEPVGALTPFGLVTRLSGQTMSRIPDPRIRQVLKPQLAVSDKPLSMARLPPPVGLAVLTPKQHSDFKVSVSSYSSLGHILDISSAGPVCEPGRLHGSVLPIVPHTAAAAAAAAATGKPVPHLFPIAALIALGQKAQYADGAPRGTVLAASSFSETLRLPACQFDRTPRDTSLRALARHIL